GRGERGGGQGEGGDQHGGAEPVDAAQRPGLARRAVAGVGDPVPEDDVGDEQGAVAEREGEPQRLAGEPDLGDRGYAGGGQDQGGNVALGPCPEGGEQDSAEELDRSHGGQRQPIHGQVEQ